MLPKDLGVARPRYVATVPVHLVGVIDLLMTFACTDGPNCLTTTVPTLIARDKSKLRIMYISLPHVRRHDMTLTVEVKRFAPLGYPGPHNSIAVQALFSHLKTPNEFAAERIHSVTI